MVDGLVVTYLHIEERGEGLRQGQHRGVDGVLALEDQVQHFNYYWMVQELLHVHLKHYIEAVLALGKAENAFSHVLVELTDVLLLLEVSTNATEDVLVDETALGDQRVDLSLLDLPADAINQQSHFDRIEL